jgi:hypothetical protein
MRRDLNGGVSNNNTFHGRQPSDVTADALGPENAGKRLGCGI